MASESLELRKLRNKLPDWFDLSAYDATNKIKLNKLLDLIEDRAYLIRDYNTTINLDGTPTIDLNKMESAIKDKGLKVFIIWLCVKMSSV